MECYSILLHSVLYLTWLVLHLQASNNVDYLFFFFYCKCNMNRCSHCENTVFKDRKKRENYCQFSDLSQLHVCVSLLWGTGSRSEAQNGPELVVFLHPFLQR